MHEVDRVDAIRRIRDDILDLCANQAVSRVLQQTRRDNLLYALALTV